MVTIGAGESSEEKTGTGPVVDNCEQNNREFGERQHRKMLSRWPLPRSRKWVAYVTHPETQEELESLCRSYNRGMPYGQPEWVKETCKKFGLESTIHKPGKPRKVPVNEQTC